MRGLAEYIMRGRRQATLVVALAAAIPLLFWVSAAALALVVLRRGISEALPVLAWGILPAIAWAWVGDLTPLLVIGGSVALATLLHSRSDWAAVLLASVPLGLGYALLLLTVLNEPLLALASQIQERLPQLLADMGGSVDEAGMARIEALLVPVLAGLMGTVHSLMVLVSIMVGRSWQARLYNPGGFREEFHRIRLSPVVAGILLLVTLFGPQFGQVALLAPITSLPLMIAGLALIHGIVGIKKFGAVWLVILYVVFVLAAQFVYPLIMLLAFIDSLFDFRSRLAPAPGPRDDDDPNGQD
ncbi:hypothetical protein [Halopseudomonas sp.]|uniref:hypothetical protein n=1 Tax=Halopseudomonas sp. TaxID=2901191 RepID=UPI003562F731